MKTSQKSPTILILMAVLPFATACRHQATPLQSSTLTCTTSISLSGKGVASVAGKDSVDIFIYNNDAAGRLDSYQRLRPDGPTLQVQSRAGRKKAVLVAGAGDGFFNYNDILSLESLKTVTHNLTDEDPLHPVRVAVADITAGPAEDNYVTLTPLLAEIVIRSLKTDFSSRPYKNAVFGNARAFLLNVSGICPVLWSGGTNPMEIYNYGREDPEGSRCLSHPEMLQSDCAQGAVMYCYPCEGSEGGLGTCTTRLVVEGTIEGVTYYYPINVGGGRVEPGHRYIYDLTITRTGTLDPDIPAESSMINAVLEAAPWEEYENEELLY